MRRKTLYLIIIFIMSITLLGVYWLFWHKPPVVDEPNTRPETVNYTDTSQGISLDYPKTATRNELSEADRQDKFIFRASEQQTRPYLITLRYEDGLRKASQVTKTPTMELLISNLDKAYPKRYENYKHASTKRYEVAGKQAAQVEFTYNGPSGELAKQRLVIVLKDENKAFYLSLQSKARDFNSLSTIFDDVANSLKL